MEFRVVENRHISGRDYLLTVEVDEETLSKIKPGQFGMVQVRSSLQLDPLLRRPLGIFDVRGNNVSFLYRVYGRGTSLLTEVKDTVSILMPLGNFIKDDASNYLFIAGGIGIGGVFLAAKLFKEKGKKVKLLYGERTKETLSALSFIEEAGIDCTVYTEDGSYGKAGFVTAELEEYTGYRWVACGPTPMLKKVKEIAERVGTECYLSMDRRMACGVGACLGCTVKTVKGYKRCCVEGPIFNAQEVIFD